MKGTGPVPSPERSCRNCWKSGGTTRYYSTRYACAYLTSDAEDARVVWFLDETSLAERTQLAKLFGSASSA